MMELSLIILLAQAVSVTLLALWLTLGVRDNLLYPTINATFTAEVMDLSRARRDYPALYGLVAHRRITSAGLQRIAFRLVVVWETLAALVLWVGVGALGAALFGLVTPEPARALALVGTLMFTTTWALFLIVGNHFNYWLCHEGAQNTHFQMTLWGLGTMIFLAAV